MTTNNHTLETERRAQEARCFTYFLINAAIAFALVLVPIFIGGLLGFLGVAAILLQLCRHFWVWPKMQAEMAERLALIPWMQQIENIYVFNSNYSLYEPDITVNAAFDYALEMLQKAGNQHGVKVHKMIFRDVYIFTSFIDQSGKRHDSRSSREEGSAMETWEKYVEACQKFEAEDRDKRLRELHGSEKTGAFVHKYIFNQQ